MQKEISIEEIKQRALRLHCNICAKSKSPAFSKFGSVVLKENQSIRIDDKFDKNYLVVHVGPSVVYMRKNGTFGKYENDIRIGEQQRKINRNHAYIIRTREQALQWANYYKPLFNTPPNANLRLEFFAERMSPDAENPAGVVHVRWEYPTPSGYSYYWDTLHGREKSWIFTPKVYVKIDPLDGTLVEAGETWTRLPIVFRPPVIKITKEQALTLARKIAPEELRMRLTQNKLFRSSLPQLGPPHAELCYKVPQNKRYYLQDGKVVFEKRKKRGTPIKIMELILVWNVRFGSYKEAFPPCTSEINIDAATGEVVDNGEF
jgi:hypothetical protein